MPGPSLLLFSRTTEYRHDSIPAAVAALSAIAEREGLRPIATEDPAVFTPEALRDAAAVAFVSTSGEVLDPAGQAALEGYVRGGGRFLGIHGASATNYAWPFHGTLVGAVFQGHPPEQAGVVVREDAAHPATAPLPERWLRTDEWYDFKASPRGRVRVLLSVDEGSYQGGGMGADHPVAWCHELGRGRSFYTALGHSIASWSEPLLLAHVQGALRWLLSE